MSTESLRVMTPLHKLKGQTKVIPDSYPICIHHYTPRRRALRHQTSEARGDFWLPKWKIEFKVIVMDNENKQVRKDKDHYLPRPCTIVVE